LSESKKKTHPTGTEKGQNFSYGVHIKKTKFDLEKLNGRNRGTKRSSGK